MYDEVFAVFERACREGDFELAEHLLLALEAMARRQEADRQLDRAYLLLAGLCKGGHWPRLWHRDFCLLATIQVTLWTVTILAGALCYREDLAVTGWRPACYTGKLRARQMSFLAEAEFGWERAEMDSHRWRQGLRFQIATAY
ncbi:hypothetical protein PO002_37610 [Cupriavidus necator]|uniref:hypothetical protein n=1 Tax=Cupriavidus necator TaxID=106590 RepID=UPI0039C478E8